MNTTKKFITMIVATIIIVSYTVYSYAASGVISGTAVRVRKSPSINGELVTNLYNTDNVKVIEKNGDWYKINYDKYEGYVHKDYIKVTGEVPDVISKTNVVEEQKKEIVKQEPEQLKSAEEIPVIENNKEEIIEKTVKPNTSVYIIPSIISSKINVVEQNKKFTITEVINNWSYIVDNQNISGWILNSNFIEENVVKEQAEVKPLEQKQNNEFKKGYVNVSSANLREKASVSAKVVAGLTLNEEVKILSEEGTWYKVEVAGLVGYVSTKLISENKADTARSAIERDSLKQIDKIAYVSVSSARIRENPNETSKSISMISKGTEIKITGEVNNFYRVNFNNKEGYIRKDLVSDTIEEVRNTISDIIENNNTTSNINSISNNNSGSSVVEYAKSFLGYKYVLGGMAPSSGFDCSGFTQYVYKKFGVNLLHSARAQATSGIHIDKSNLQLGDLLIFTDGSTSKIGHVGIYIGNNNMIHAANAKRGVVTDTIASGYYKTNYIEARRVL